MVHILDAEALTKLAEIEGEDWALKDGNNLDDYSFAAFRSAFEKVM